MNKLICFLSVMIGGLLITACTDDEEVEQLNMPIYLNIPMLGDGQRALGDPGEGGQDKLPRYLYAFFVENLGGEVYAVDVMEEMLLEEYWEADPNFGVFRYKRNLQMVLPYRDIQESGSRLYAITAYSPIDFERPTTKSEVENLVLDLTRPLNAGTDLRNIYTNPMGDVNNGRVVKKGQYLYEAELMCYHMAAAVDVQWDVNVDHGAGYYLEQIRLADVPRQGFFFKPVQNRPSTGNCLTEFTNMGSRWYGRNLWYIFDCGEVDCEYVLKTPQGEEKVVRRTYGAAATENGDGPADGNVQEVFANYYRIIAKLGYP